MIPCDLNYNRTIIKLIKTTIKWIMGIIKYPYRGATIAVSFKVNVLRNTLTKPMTEKITNKPTIPQSINCFPDSLSSPPSDRMNLNTPHKKKTSARPMMMRTVK